MPQETISHRVNQFIASTDVPEFTARNIADAIGVTAVNVVSAALSKLKSDKKITYRVIPHEHWGNQFICILIHAARPPIRFLLWWRFPVLSAGRTDS